MNRFIKTLVFCILMTFNSSAFSNSGDEMIVRISEIEIKEEYLQEYKAILKEESEASVRLEQGVISLFPMFQKESPTQVRILEIYSNKEAYELHIKNPHFIEYKTTTMKMIKSLKLVDMQVMDAESMKKIFVKMANEK